MEATVCDRCGRRLDPAPRGSGRLDCDTASGSRTHDPCGRRALEPAEEVDGHPNDRGLKAEEAR